MNFHVFRAGSKATIYIFLREGGWEGIPDWASWDFPERPEIVLSGQARNVLAFAMNFKAFRGVLCILRSEFVSWDRFLYPEIEGSWTQSQDASQDPYYFPFSMVWCHAGGGGGAGPAPGGVPQRNHLKNPIWVSAPNGGSPLQIFLFKNKVILNLNGLKKIDVQFLVTTRQITIRSAFDFLLLVEIKLKIKIKRKELAFKTLPLF